jgi:hypothetical protein
LIGKEIAELRKNGTVIYQDVAVPCFAFLGDTTCEVLEKNPILFDYPVIIIECTFLLDDHQGKICLLQSAKIFVRKKSCTDLQPLHGATSDFELILISYL